MTAPMRDTGWTPRHILLHRLYQLYAMTDGKPRCMRPDGHPAGRTHTCMPAPAGYQPIEVTA